MDRRASPGLDGPGTKEPRIGLPLRRSPRTVKNSDRKGRRYNSELRAVPTDGGHSRRGSNAEEDGEGRVRTEYTIGLELETAEEEAWMSSADWEDEACKIM